MMTTPLTTTVNVVSVRCGSAMGRVGFGETTSVSPGKAVAISIVMVTSQLAHIARVALEGKILPFDAVRRHLAA